MRSTEEKLLELQRAQNRKKYPEVVAFLDALENAGLGKGIVKYIGPVRDETYNALVRKAWRDKQSVGD